MFLKSIISLAAGTLVLAALPSSALAVSPEPDSQRLLERTVAARVLYGVVGPGYTITLRDAAGNAVTEVAPGSVTFDIRDRATNHDFHLVGPGFDKTTGVAAEGHVRWTVGIKKGAWAYFCTPHRGFMHGAFTVGTGTPPSPTPPAPPAVFPLAITNIVTKLDQPTWVGAPRGGGPDLYVTLRKGVILRIGAGGSVTTVVDISGSVGTVPTERGLYSLVFHPAFKKNDRVFLNYADRKNHVRVDEIRLKDGAYVPGSRRHVIVIPQKRAANHDGGQLAFSKDGYLLIPVGDGGGQNDPDTAGQNVHVLVGKILRINVDGAKPYTVPRGNPFARRPKKGRPEIYAVGLRNPFRMSVDPATGDLWVGDVGQGKWEELDRIPFRKHQRLLNFGWSGIEGNTPYHRQPMAGGRAIKPVYVYPHGPLGCTIIGGVTYRGSLLPKSWQGAEVFGDACAGALSTLRWMHGMAMVRPYTHVLPLVVCVGADSVGELVAVTLSGRVVRLSAAPGTVPVL